MKKLSSVVILALSLTMIQTSATAAVGERVTLAYQGPLSGPERSAGQSQLRSMKFAIKLFAEKNPSAPVINIIEIDDLGDPMKAQELAPQTVSKSEIIGLVGSAYSGASIASIPTWSAASLTAISPSASRASLTSLLPAGRSTFFRVVSPELEATKSLLDAAVFKVDNPRLYIVSDLSSYSENFRISLESAAKARGINVVGTVGVTEREVPSSSLANKITSLGANVVITTGYYPHTFEVTRSLRSNSYTGVIAATDASYDPTMLKRAEYLATEGLRVLAPEVNMEELSAPLAKRYQEVTGQEPDLFSIATINATSILLKCINEGARTRVEIYDCVKVFRGFSIDGMPLSFKQNGDLAQNDFPVYEVKQGNLLLMRNLYPVLYNNVLNGRILQGMQITKGTFNQNIPQKTSLITIPSGLDPLNIVFKLASTSYSVEAKLTDAKGLVTRLPYPIRIEKLDSGIHKLEIVIRDNVMESSEITDLLIAQNFSLPVPEFSVTEVSSDSFQVNFAQSALANSYDLKILASGAVLKIVSNFNSGEKVSGFKPGSSLSLILVAKSTSEFADSPEVASPIFAVKTLPSPLTCTKGKLVKLVSGANPKCPKGYVAKKRS